MASSQSVNDVLIIGAGPAGSVAGTALARAGRSVVCLERGYFPRHVIGESLLPRCNALLDKVGLLEAVRSRGYMVKHGAVFRRGDESERFDFSEALPGDHPDTFQVPREDFDQLLAVEARRAGLDLRYGQQVDAVEFDPDGATATVSDLEQERTYEIRARFVLDCSGFGRVLPRLLDLERPSSLPLRVSCFSQVENDFRPEGEYEGDIWICIHPVNGWIWIIPFSNGRTSIGMICDKDHWEAMDGSPRERLFRFLQQEPNAAARLGGAVAVAPTRTLQGYSKKAAKFHGDRWALVGNASDFLDPVFSSGVTLALEAAVLAAGLVDRTLSGDDVDWAEEYDGELQKAVRVFLAFIEGWYDKDLETIFFGKTKLPRIKRFVTSILGGNVLRDDNPLVADPANSLKQLCKSAGARPVR